MRWSFLILLIVLVHEPACHAQLYFPLENYYHGEIERHFLTDTLVGGNESQHFYRQHLSSKPILQSRTTPDSIYWSADKRYYWLTQKLFKENFLIFEGDGFWCAVDPIVDLEAGHDFEIDSLHYKYWNTRGLRVQARFMDKIGFTTAFYENQAFVPDYQKTFADAHAEYVPNPDVTYYNRQNAIIPGYARTKSFKTDGYDFAFAEGHLSIEPNRHFNLQFGNGNQFVGNGYRSLLLSDFSTNYPFLKAETNLWQGRIQYWVTYALLQNLYRLPHYSTPEATYERKIATFHYLDVAITKNITLGVFEGSLWKRTDSLGTHEPDWLFLNPLILSNSLARSDNSPDYNRITGFNLNVQFAGNAVYGQVVIDHGSIAAYQAGIKAYDLILPKLDLQAEYNHADQNTYLTARQRYNFSHNNLPLAHPLSAGFDELVFRVSYQYNRWFAENRTVYIAQHNNDTLNMGTSVLLPQSTIALQFYDRTRVFYNQLEAGYRFNKRYNLQAVVGYLFRNEQTPFDDAVTNYVYIGVRTRLKNKTFDF